MNESIHWESTYTLYINILQISDFNTMVTNILQSIEQTLSYPHFSIFDREGSSGKVLKVALCMYVSM